MRYAEYVPVARLRRHVECYWTLEAEVPRHDPVSARVLPDGCMDILFHLGDQVDAGAVNGATTTFVGAMTRALPVQYGGRVDLVGVRFRPGGASPFLGLPANEVTDGIGPLHALWGPEADRLRDRLGETPAADRPGVLDAVLSHLLGQTRRLADERVLRASEQIARCRGAIPVDRVAEQCGLGRRQLERRFLACVGLTPKAAGRIARFRSLLAFMQAYPGRSLSELAHAVGYADQAHMTREFRALAEVTPATYRRGLAGIEAEDGAVVELGA